MPETQLLALCWGLAYAYRATVQHPQGGERVSGSEDIQTDTVAKPETQPSTVAPIVKKKQWKGKSTQLVREEEASPKREQERKKQKRQPVLQQSSHNNRRGKRQKS